MDYESHMQWWPDILNILEHIQQHKLKTLTVNQALNIIDPDSKRFDGVPDDLFCCLREGVLDFGSYRFVSKSHHKRRQKVYGRQWRVKEEDEIWDVLFDCQFLAFAVHKYIELTQHNEDLQKELEHLFECTSVEIREVKKC